MTYCLEGNFTNTKGQSSDWQHQKHQTIDHIQTTYILAGARPGRQAAAPAKTVHPPLSHLKQKHTVTCRGLDITLMLIPQVSNPIEPTCWEPPPGIRDYIGMYCWFWFEWKYLVTKTGRLTAIAVNPVASCSAQKTCCQDCHRTRASMTHVKPAILLQFTYNKKSTLLAYCTCNEC
jgi:hypothetical protein